jgi:hypothetical protein
MSSRKYRPLSRERQATFEGLHVPARPEVLRREVTGLRLEVTPLPDGTGWEVRHPNGVLLGEALMDVTGEVGFWFDRSRGGAWSAHVLFEIAAFLRAKSIPV